MHPSVQRTPVFGVESQVLVELNRRDLAGVERPGAATPRQLRVQPHRGVPGRRNHRGRGMPRDRVDDEVGAGPAQGLVVLDHRDPQIAHRSRPGSGSRGSGTDRRGTASRRTRTHARPRPRSPEGTEAAARRARGRAHRHRARRRRRPRPRTARGSDACRTAPRGPRTTTSCRTARPRSPGPGRAGSGCGRSGSGPSPWTGRAPARTPARRARCRAGRTRRGSRRAPAAATRADAVTPRAAAISEKLMSWFGGSPTRGPATVHPRSSRASTERRLELEHRPAERHAD